MTNSVKRRQKQAAAAEMERERLEKRVEHLDGLSKAQFERAYRAEAENASLRSRLEEQGKYRCAWCGEDSRSGGGERQCPHSPDHRHWTGGEEHCFPHIEEVRKALQRPSLFAALPADREEEPE